MKNLSRLGGRLIRYNHGKDSAERSFPMLANGKRLLSEVLIIGSTISENERNKEINARCVFPRAITIRGSVPDREEATRARRVEEGLDRGREGITTSFYDRLAHTRKGLNRSSARIRPRLLRRRPDRRKGTKEFSHVFHEATSLGSSGVYYYSA